VSQADLAAAGCRKFFRQDLTVGLRLGFRLAPHVYLSVPLGHGRRLAAHHGHANPLGLLLGLAILWVFVRGVWGLLW
jgi:hypothetical protein